MSRRRRGRPQVIRGWQYTDGEVPVPALTLDNVPMRSDPLVLGDNVDENIVSGEAPTFLVRRIILWVDMFCVPAALNGSGRVPYEMALAVIDSARLDTFKELGGDTLFEVLEEFEEVAARVLYLERGYVYQLSAQGEPAIVQPDVAATNQKMYDWSFKGGLNVREGQQLALIYSQSQVFVQPTNTTDFFQANWSAKILMQKRRNP